MIAIRETSINNLQRNRRSAPGPIIIRIEAAGGKFEAGSAGATAVGLAGGVDGTLEELLVDGAVVDAVAVGVPLPGVLTAVAGATLEAVVL